MSCDTQLNLFCYIIHILWFLKLFYVWHWSCTPFSSLPDSLYLFVPVQTFHGHSPVVFRHWDFASVFSSCIKNCTQCSRYLFPQTWKCANSFVRWGIEDKVCMEGAYHSIHSPTISASRPPPPLHGCRVLPCNPYRVLIQRDITLIGYSSVCFTPVVSVNVVGFFFFL